MDPEGSPAPPLVTIGDITCTATEVITPSGRAPVSSVSWTLTDMSRTTREIPVWAIVCAVLFFFVCFLGLLFLLAKEERTAGWAQVTLHAPGLLHVTQIPVASQAAVMDINARVNYARSLSFRSSNG